MIFKDWGVTIPEKSTMNSGWRMKFEVKVKVKALDDPPSQS